jgi:hypothetical protein
VAICDWLVEVEKDTISPDNIGGIVEPRILQQIIERALEEEDEN